MSVTSFVSFFLQDVRLINFEATTRAVGGGLWHDAAQSGTLCVQNFKVRRCLGGFTPVAHVEKFQLTCPRFGSDITQVSALEAAATS